MSWINRIMLRAVQIYLVLVFALVVTPLGLLRRMLGGRPLTMSRVAGGWTARPGIPYFHRQERGSSLFGREITTLLRQGRFDYAFIVLCLLPVKLFLKIDKSTAVDPSIYVMY